MKKKFLLLAGAVSIFIAAGATARAGEKTEIIPPPPAASNTVSTPDGHDLLQKALDAYEKNSFREAMKDAQQAQVAIRNKRDRFYHDLLPSAPGGGWVVDDGTSTGGDLRPLIPAPDNSPSSLTRSYVANGHRVTITFQPDSSLLAYAQLAMAQNDANMSDEEVKGNKAVYTEQPNNSLYRIPAARSSTLHVLKVLTDDVIIQVSSDSVSKDILLQFAKLVDYDKLKAVK